jgi:hypothetical protein
MYGTSIISNSRSIFTELVGNLMKVSRRKRISFGKVRDILGFKLYVLERLPTMGS